MLGRMFKVGLLYYDMRAMECSFDPMLCVEDCVSVAVADIMLRELSMLIALFLDVFGS
jgi:hypothetical protein